MSDKTILEQDFDTFQNFWQEINPLGRLGKKLSGFIYRGESSCKNKLLPAVLRDGQVKQDEPSQVYYEIDLLCQFYREANNYGLYVPNNHILRGSSPDTIMGYGLRWISNDFEETAVLAQHYGIKTRLLDWTRDIFAAFYFASKDLLIENDSNKDIEYFVIYALNFEYLIRFTSIWQVRQSSITTNPDPLPLKFIIPHYSDIPNAYAQYGILSYSEIDIKGYSPKSWVIDTTPLDIRLEKLAGNKESYYELPDEETLLYKFYLPKSEAINMFTYISGLNYSHSKLFPGYAGIMKTLEEKRLIETHFEGNPTHE